MYTNRPPARPSQPLLSSWGAVCAALIVGAVACGFYARQDLLLSHYDAKAHLVVARRVIDSIMPGWQQVGAVWLPLPHLLNVVPVQVDWFYRTGASAIAISMAAFAAAAGACYQLILEATGSRLAAASGAAVLILNPNLLYLQATPMTESLLIALMTGSTLAVARWVHDATLTRRRWAGWLLAASCLCRYEAWPVAALALAGAVWALRRTGVSWRQAARRVAAVAAYPMAAIVLFLFNSRFTTGAWFVSSGFFVADNADMGKPFHAAASVWWGAHVITGYGIVAMATLGFIVTAATIARSRARSSLVVLLALAGAAALPWYAFVSGHPFRIRYMVPLVPAAAVFAGLGVGLSRRLRPVLAATVLGFVALETASVFGSPPMVSEAQWDRGNQRGRQAVTTCLAKEYRGEKILASMGSLAHYMQELSHEGFGLHEFLHEGIGDIWQAALRRPQPHVGWVLIEEQAEGGDLLAGLARENPGFLSGFSRACEGGGVALYRRTTPPAR